LGDLVPPRARIGGGGALVLKQDPVECVFQFLYSSNNNTKRIGKMVWTLASYGERRGEVGGFVFHWFPTIESLACVSEQELRDAGFGYRSALGAFLPVAFVFYATSISCYVCFILYYSSSSV
jgi:3-methyladenine DNA glycosylase/8-oxoguanine DNA glycosylase